jgi:hypothetical protein
MRKNEIISKEAIVAEYMTSDITYRELEAKYGYPYASICHWVNGRKMVSRPGRMRPKKQKGVPAVLPEDVKLLKRALLQTQLHNKLLEEILRQAEEQTGLDLRKKVGTKRS